MARVSIRRAVLLAVLLLVVAIQFFPTGLDRVPPDPAQALESTLQPGPEVTRILRRACNDCHGTARQWPWYASVAPVSWLIANDVNGAREHVDFVHWAQYAPHTQARMLEQMCDELQRGEMPLRQYLWLHRGARVSPAEIQLLCAWTERERTRIAGAGER